MKRTGKYASRPCSRAAREPVDNAKSLTTRPVLRDVQNQLTKRPCVSKIPRNTRIITIDVASSEVSTQTTLKIEEKSLQTDAKVMKIEASGTSLSYLQSLRVDLKQDYVNSDHHVEAHTTQNHGRKGPSSKSYNVAAASTLLPNSNMIGIDEYIKLKKIRMNGMSPIQSRQDANFRYPETRKKILPRSKKVLLSKFTESAVFSLDIYQSRYLKENVEVLLSFDQQFIMKRNYLSAHNRHFTKDMRLNLLSWILDVSDEIGMDSTTYVKFIRFFDAILAKIAIDASTLQLFAIGACWLIVKLNDYYVPKAKTLLNLCRNGFQVRQLLQVERRLLLLTNYNLRFSCPQDFVNVGLFYMQIPEKHQFRDCVNYVLDVFSLNEYYSCYTSMEIASAAVHLSMIYFKSEAEPPFFQTFSTVCDLVCAMQLNLANMYVKKAKNGCYEKIFIKHMSDVRSNASICLQGRVLATKICDLLVRNN